MAVKAQLQDEITRRKKQEDYYKQQTNAIKDAGERLRTRINELNTHGPIGESDMLKVTDSVEAAASLDYDEKAVLENIFQQNLVLQKPKLDSAVREDS